MRRLIYPLAALLALALPAAAQDISAEVLRTAAKTHAASLVRVQATTTVAIGRLPGLGKRARRTHEVSVGGVVVGDGLILVSGPALDPAAASYALLGVPAATTVLSARVIGPDGRIRDAQWLGEDPASRLALVRVDAAGRDGLTAVSWGAAAAGLGDGLGVLSLTPAPLGTHVRAEATRVAFVSAERWGVSPQLPQSVGGLVVDAKGGAVGFLGHAPLEGISKGDVLRPDLLTLAQAGYVIPSARFQALVQSPPKEVPQAAAARRGRAWLGIKAQVLTPELAEQLGLSFDVGVRIEQLFEGPAKAAGLEVGDVFMRMDGEPLDLDPGESFNDLVEDYNVGEKVPFVVRRGEKQKQVELELARGPVRPADAERLRIPELGVELRALTFFDRTEAKLDAKALGAVVLSLEADGAASRAGVQQGDMVIAVEGKPVQGLADLRQTLLAPGAHGLTIRRRGEELTLRVRH